MQYSASSFQDLAFLVPKEGALFPGKFLIFVDSIKEAEAITKYLRKLLGPNREDLVIWYHSMMSDCFRADEVIAIQIGTRSGFVATDSFGMVSSLNEMLYTVKTWS
jgi:Lhr-like helicase